MENTEIEWATHSFNPWQGCVKISDGCTICYAETLSKRWGKDIWGPAKTTSRQLTSDSYWNEPIKWNRKAKEMGERHRVFCASMSDVFEDHPQVLDARRRLLDLIVNTPHLDWLLLTKRPENVNWMIEQATGFSESAMWFHTVGDHVWMGTSVEDQANADKRIPELLNVPAKIRFLSCEPLLGPVDIKNHLHRRLQYYFPVTAYGEAREYLTEKIDWVIVGGESGHGARLMDLSWADSLIAQCQAAGVAIHVKQLGSVFAKKMQLNSAKGGDWNEWPERLRIREYPLLAQPVAA